MPSNNNSDNYSNNNNSEQHLLTQPSDENPPQTATAATIPKWGLIHPAPRKTSSFDSSSSF
jgi:hypothetical protein